MSTDQQPLVSIHDLKVHFPVAGAGLFGRSTRIVKAVDGVSLDIKSGETVGLVGESGCGKTTLGRAVLRLVEPTSGSVRFEDKDVLAAGGGGLRRLRRDM